jgi:hypothetical protein
VVDYVNGYVLGAAAANREEDGDNSLLRELRERGKEAFPVQHRILVDAVPSSRGSFDLGLDVIIAGIEALAANQRA